MVLLALFAGLAAAQEQEEPSEFIGYVSRELNVHSQPVENATVIGRLPRDVDIDVYDKKRTFTKIGYEGLVGYVLTKHVERVQRRDPFGGLMPGVPPQAALVRLSRDLTFLPEGFRYPIAMTEGTWLAVQEIEGEALRFPYMREVALAQIPYAGTITEITPIVAWDEAHPGDLIGCFSTFFSTSGKNELNVGRMYNIALAVERLDGRRIEPGEIFSFNSYCAPYSAENGYEKAPILSGSGSVGYGGGTCQVCTTLYNVVLRIPARIVDMHWHGQGGVKYIPSGFDATVGSKWDLCFENVLPYSIEIRYAQQDGVMTAMFLRAQEE